MTAPLASVPNAPIDDRERGCWVAFSHAPGIGPARVRRLLLHFGSLARAWAAPPAGLLLAGLDRRVLAGLLALRARLDPQRELERARRGGAEVIVWPDDAYPWRLAAIPDPPPVLYVRGTLLPADHQAIAIVGTRRPTYYGRDIAERLAGALAGAGLTVVSGLARGVDTQAHRGALGADGGRTLAVLGHGLDTIYPPENRRLAAEIAERGALLTDYPPGTSPEAQNFPPRNRIISGLAAGVLVVEAGAQSGALITTRYAAEQGRDVFAVPGPITSPASTGCHRLIQDGAKLVIDVDDILNELDPQRGTASAGTTQQMALDFSDGPELAAATPEAPPAEAPAELPAEVDRLLRAIGQVGQPAHIDHIARSLALPVHLVTGELARLELLGHVRHVGGMRYVVAARA